MSRTQKSYTIVSLEKEHLAASHYANADALKDAIAKNFAVGHPEFMVFEGEYVDIAIDVAPSITIGGKKERKPRGPNKKKNGAKVGADFFEKKTTTETTKAKE